MKITRTRIGKAAFKPLTMFDAKEPRFVVALNAKECQTENKTAIVDRDVLGGKNLAFKLTMDGSTAEIIVEEFRLLP